MTKEETGRAKLARIRNRIKYILPKFYDPGIFLRLIAVEVLAADAEFIDAHPGKQ